MRNWLFTTEPKKSEYYRGVLIHADTGLHDQLITLIHRYVRPRAEVLDVGAGAGALSIRLADAGYRVTALDVDREKWRADKIPFHQLDLNVGLSGSIEGQFDAACIVEVIEHVENPWQLLREARQVVRPDGYVFLSTPNVASFLSRATFLMRGRFHQFDYADLAYGHINPMTPFEIETVARQTGWRLVEMRPGGYLPVFDFADRGPRSILRNIVRGAAYVLARGEKRGWCLLVVLQNPA